jgi:hypothetical protein
MVSIFLVVEAVNTLLLVFKFDAVVPVEILAVDTPNASL